MHSSCLFDERHGVSHPEEHPALKQQNALLLLLEGSPNIPRPPWRAAGFTHGAGAGPLKAGVRAL